MVQSIPFTWRYQTQAVYRLCSEDGIEKNENIMGVFGLCCMFLSKLRHILLRHLSIIKLKNEG